MSERQITNDERAIFLGGMDYATKRAQRIIRKYLLDGRVITQADVKNCVTLMGAMDKAKRRALAAKLIRPSS